MAPAIAYEVSSPSFTSSEPEISISEYIYRRILQLGIKNIFGVPGDFVLDFCEEISKVPELNWVGTCNELNGSYAADAYGKISGKIGVFVSTFGVGELSALNGVSGAFAEFAPLLHIVGTSSRQQKQSEGKCFHHLVQKPRSRTPNHYVYEQVVKNFSVVQESLWDIDAAVDQIDNAIEQVYLQSRPGYIFLPSDMATAMIPSSALYRPLNLKLQDQNEILSTQVANEILQKLYQSKSPAIMVDYLCRPFRQQDQINELIEKLQGKVNLYTTALSKGFVDESNPRFVGVYAGRQTPHQQTVELIESHSDFVLDIGSFDVQNNNGGFTCKYQPGALCEMNEYMCQINGKEYDCHFIHVLKKLVQLLDITKVPTSPSFKKITSSVKSTLENDSEEKLTQNYLAKELEKFMKPNDILVVETCSFLFTVPDLQVPDQFRLLAQNFYNSIGYALPATIGACLANRDLGYAEEDSRVILIQGDGSALMTLQELTTYMRQDIKPMILLLNNDGYTVERIILGENSLYNDIPANVQWTKLFNALGDVENTKTTNVQIRTKQELSKLFAHQESNATTTPTLQMCELILDRMDAPDRFKQMVGKLPN